MSIFFIASCIENPFVKNNINEDKNRILFGKVILDDESNHSDIFIWLEQFNLSTRSDENGNFKFTIPAKSETHPGGGFTGYVSIYYYVANYKLASSRVFVFDGNFKYDDSDLNENGEIQNTIILKKRINIITHVSPNQFEASYNDSVILSATLKVEENETIQAGTLKNRYGEWTGIFIKSLSEPDKDIYRVINGGLREDVITDERTWEIKLPFVDLNLSSGLYEIIPYVIIVENLPTGLIESLGDGVRSYTENYFNYPIRVETASLQISE